MKFHDSLLFNALHDLKSMTRATVNATTKLKTARTMIEVRTEPAAANLSSLSHFDVEFA